MGRAGRSSGWTRTAFRQAVALAPTTALHHCNLGNALQELGRTDEAVGCYRKALECDPNHRPANNNLGVALKRLGRYAEAVPFYRKALALRPDAETYGNLGISLAQLDRGQESADAFAQAVALDPRNAGMHGALGAALLALGRFAEARDASRRCAELLPEGNPMRRRAEAQRKECERLLALEAKLAAALRADPPRGDPAELVELAELCRKYKRLNAGSTRLYGAAFASGDRGTRAAHRYRAACAAALAGCGRGADAGTAEERERGRWRGQALAWLREELAALGEQVRGARGGRAARTRESLERWRSDPALAGVRDSEALARLPLAERTEWRKFWDEVAALLRG